MSVSQLIFTKKNIKGYMELALPYSKIWIKSFSPHHISGPIDMFLLFYDQDDTESEL